MTFSLPKKPRTTLPVKSTLGRTSCSLLMAAAGLILAGTVAGQDGDSRSSFRPRADGPPATLLLPVQAKSAPVPAKGPSTDVPPGITPPAKQDPYEAYIRLEPPGRERLFGSRDTQRELEERIRQERRDSSTTITHP